MGSFMKLFAFEINRFIKLYIALLAVIFIIQLGTVLFEASSYMALVKEVTKGGRASPEQFLNEYWSFSLVDVIYAPGFLIPIALGAVSVIIYLFFIWYRDWFARNTFIYRLLMLPVNRMTIYFAKLATIIVSVLGLISAQLVYLVIYKQIVKWIVPIVYRTDMKTSLLVASSDHLSVLIPTHFSLFLIIYGLGTLFIIVLFTGILFERSFKLVGLLLGIIYTSFAIGLFILPFVVQFIFFDTFYLYTDEMFYVQLVISFIIGGVSLWISYILINRKVTV